MGVWRVPYHGASEDFLRANVNAITNDCIEWPYCKNANGYGLATIDGKQRTANNWMCRLAHGDPILIWNEAAHRCGNRGCVNPRHLRWATRVENSADRKLHGTENIGENNGKTALTEADVLAIRNAPPNINVLAERYGVSRRCIAHIRSGTRWAHVGGPRATKERNSRPMCRHGHIYDEANTRWTKDGYRQCQACNRAAARRSYHRKRQAA